MAGLNFTILETSAIPVYSTLAPWQISVVGAIFTWLIFAQLTALSKHLRALVQPFVLRHVEEGVPVVLAIQVPNANQLHLEPAVLQPF